MLDSIHHMTLKLLLKKRGGGKQFESSQIRLLFLWILIYVFIIIPDEANMAEMLNFKSYLNKTFVLVLNYF